MEGWAQYIHFFIWSFELVEKWRVMVVGTNTHRNEKTSNLVEQLSKEEKEHACIWKGSVIFVFISAYLK